MAHRSSYAPSSTTYHSFNDIELSGPPPEPSESTYTSSRSSSKDPYGNFIAEKMQRQDSGYESCGPPSRSSTFNSSRPPVSRTNSTTSGGRLRSRPSTRRSSTKPGTHPYQVRSYAASQPQAYYQFPALDVAELEEPPSSELSPPLPQTTHYWTSDSTRRLEYAAIDAASRGVKGWIRKHLVPECFVPRDSKHLAFDDDAGSVRRYRLELEDPDDDGFRRKSWRFWKE